jgi:hypothetical protein
MKTKIVSFCLLIVIVLASCTPVSPTKVILPTDTPPPPTLTPTPEPAPVTPIRLGDYELLSPEDMRSDLDELFHQIETVHPNPYTKRPKSEVDLDRQNIYDQLDQPLPMIEFFTKVTPLVASLGDQHTQILFPEKIFPVIEESELFIPLEVTFDGQRGFITGNYSGNQDIPLGAEVLSINSTAISNIRKDAEPYEPDFFPFRLWLLFGSVPEYDVEFLLPGETAAVILDVPGVKFATIMQNLETSEPPDPVVYKKIPDESIGVLDLNTFTGIGPLLKKAFVQIQEDGVEHLIIDVRTNPGGSDIGPTMDYLTDQPYRICSRLYRAPFKGYGSGEPRELECVLLQPFDAAERFTGKLYLLIGPDSFSAPIILANILQDYGLATLIGEETPDTASFCASAVDSYLPRTKLPYRISVECYVRPSGVLDDLPVIPDITVETTIEDQIAGRDPVLEYTLELIRSGQIP